MNASLKFVIGFLLAANFSFGQDYHKRIDSLIKASHLENPEIGISVGFLHNNAPFFTAYGKISKESQQDIDRNSVFEIASITKIITANLIAQAAIENKLKLDDYIDAYLPRQYVLHKNIANKIKISDLASHQSGLADLDFAKYIEMDPQQPLRNFTQENLTALVNNCTELTDYGRYRYSTVGFALLGQIVENVYGKSYDDMLRERMVRPLRLTATLTRDFNVKNMTTGHSPNGTVQEFFKWNVAAAAGLVKSNAADMVKFLKAILDSESTIGKAALITEKIFYKDEKRELGLGTNIVTDDNNTLYMKSGDSMGQSCIICYNRARNWGVIILLDYRNSKMRNELLNRISEIILE
ncbi:serine hydrolase domain-containing protein [Chitinophaga rhizosphaerae]|uniref:serine hydrolase domain-containing protein n=1 Tax=Chitinophaga rhizosphaerae TaxID=1864947 RepID=UPI000F7FAE11|nr:serine hydrolase domain-containing protein [Chitinophaga rhizosphaerae]